MRNAEPLRRFSILVNPDFVIPVELKYAKERATVIAAKCINCRHRHLVFTIPEELRVFFRKDTSLLHLLFTAASQTILSYFYDLNKISKL